MFSDSFRIAIFPWDVSVFLIKAGGLGVWGFVLGKFALDFDREVGFGFAAGEHGNTTFSADFDVEFQVDFFDFGDGQIVECPDRVLRIALDSWVDFGQFNAHCWGDGGLDGAVGFEVRAFGCRLGGRFEQNLVGLVVFSFEDEALGHGVIADRLGYPMGEVFSIIVPGFSLLWIVMR